jgi:membrane associated rhomboid family serine protease
VVTGIASYIANSLVRTQPVVAVGASGAVCGILGAILAEGIMNWDSLNFPKFQLVTWGLQVGVFLALVSQSFSKSKGFIPQLNNVAHVGGFWAGICCGLVFLPRIACKQKRNAQNNAVVGDKVQTALFIFGVVGLILIFFIGPIMLSMGMNISTPGACLAFLSTDC